MMWPCVFKAAAGAMLAWLLFSSPHAWAQAAPRTEISFARFFGSCEADFGSVTDPALATGECGIITALANRFNATNTDGIVLRPQVIEHGSYYNQLGARIIGRDLPAIIIMHSSVLSDFARRELLEPLDEGFQSVGISSADFTPQAERAVNIGGRRYALPFDTHAWLWHLNHNLLKQAGLVNPDGSVLVPRSPQELLAQARRFKAATGKPYFIWLTVNDAPFFARTLMTLVHQQGGTLFPKSPTEIDLRSREVRDALELMQTMYNEGLASHGHDYAQGIRAFVAGQGAVMVNGTWLIGDLNKQATVRGSALERGYATLPFPTLFSQPAMWADNHVMAMLKGGTGNPAERRAALLFLKFLYDEGGAWARTGQLPTRQSVLDSGAFRALPFRPALVPIGQFGAGLPLSVARQSRVASILGDGVGSIILHGKPVDATLARAERSITQLLQRESQFSAGRLLAPAKP